MAESKSYQYYDLPKPTLPYKSYTSPVDESSHFILGSQNILASQIGYLEKRPGFSTPIESTPTVIDGTIVRIFKWRRWGGSFFTMICSVTETNAVVYKLEQGVDPSFVQIWTSGSTVPFDFVVSDNFCFFGNASDMRKYDGNQVTKWGVDAPPTAPPISLQSGTLPPGMTFDGSTGTLSGTPTTAGTTQITFTATDATGATGTKTLNFEVAPQTLHIVTPPNLVWGRVGFAYTQGIAAEFGPLPYAYTLFSGSLPPGLTLNALTGVISGTPTTAGPYSFAIQVTDATSHTAVASFFIYIVTATTFTLTNSISNGTVGVPYTGGTVTASGGTAPYTFQYLVDDSILTAPYNTFPQGLTFNPASPVVTFGGTPTVPGSYQFLILARDSTGLTAIQPASMTIAATSVTVTTPALPTAYVGQLYIEAVTAMGGVGPYTWTFTAGNIDGQTGYVYGYSYTTIYGHESNVSPLSDSTGIFTSQDPAILLISSPDPQVNGINLYRTTDGGIADPAIMRLVVHLPNTNQTYLDGIPDQFLGIQNGPGININTPPTPTIGFVWSNGRIYGFVDNKTYYSGFEEVSNGIPEEAWPSGVDGNYYPWPSQVGGMAVTQNGVDIGMSEQFWQVSGDSLDTFRRSLLLDKAGVGSPTCITAVGNTVLWVDSARQVWSSSDGEIGEPIRTDLTSIIPAQTYIGYHKSRNYNWIYVLDAASGKLYIYDVDLDQWNTPWTVPATAICSGEISVGHIGLLAAIGGTVYELTPGTFTDGATTYHDDIKSNLIPMTSGRTTSARSKMMPRQLEEIMFEMEAIDFDGTYPSFVGFIGDSNPVTSVAPEWTNLTPLNVTPQYIPRTRTICQYRFIADSDTIPSVRGAYWITFAASNLGWTLYSLTVSWIDS